MDVKGTLKAVTLALRRELEGRYDAQGAWRPGDLERRLAAIGVRCDRAPVPVNELRLTAEDREARRVVDAFLKSRWEAGQSREAAVAEFVRDAAYTWANRLLALRCMEARSLIDEVILQKDAYGGRSLQHNRLAKKQPERCAGEDEGLFAVLFDEFARRAEELPLLFDPRAPEVALRPSVAALKRSIALLSGTLAVKAQEAATDEIFTAPDALGWTYQYWNTEEKDRVFEKVRTKKGSKIEGAEIIPATCIYTEPYMVKFLVQNSLGALWMGMHPDSRLSETWEYYVRGADRAPVSKKAIADITFLDPACGSGHFLIEAFELFYAMYLEEGALTDPAQVCASILERNLYGIDIDERAAQIAALALVMKAKEKAPDFVPRRVNLVATNIRLPSGKERLEAFLAKHPEDAALRPALLSIFESLAHADEIGSLLQIEEPVEKELRAVQARYEAAGLPREQQALWSEYRKPVQEQLPLGVTSYESWKERALARIREHLDADARGTDLGAAFFGEAASKGLSLLDVLSRRYDVVAANPPYMGSKNMGPGLKKFVERHFAPGKRDLYAAFILRCLQLAANGGRVAMVTQQSWMFLTSYTGIRAANEGEHGKGGVPFRGVLRDCSLEVLAHLGRYAFSEIGNAAVAPVLFALAKTKPADNQRLWACRLRAPRESHIQATLLRGAISSTMSALVFRPRQGQFLAVPRAPLCYWLRERFVELLRGRTLDDAALALSGISTGSNDRFLRRHWERLKVAADRWRPYSKGGGFSRWYGLLELQIDWHRCLIAISDSGSGAVRNLRHQGQAGWTYSEAAGGALALRVLPVGARFDAKGPGVFPKSDIPLSMGLMAILNTRVPSYLLRSLAQTLDFDEAYVPRVPIPKDALSVDESLGSACLSLKRYIAQLDIRDPEFTNSTVHAPSLRDEYVSRTDSAQSVAAVLHTIEGVSERKAVDAYAIDDDDLAAVLEETGTPVGWFPLIVGYDALPDVPSGLSVPADVRDSVSRGERRTLSADAVSDLKRRLRAAYDGGPGGKVDEEDEPGDGEDRMDAEDEGEAAVSGARIPIPAETFLEELAQRFETHPISIYWLLRELREKEGVVSNPELVRFVADYVGVLVLRLTGHLWPGEIEAGEAPQPWADEDGIIPLAEGVNEPALLARVRARIAADFGSDQAAAVEREFGEIIGRPLGAWLSSEFFKRHIAQFRKRPIAFQIVSSTGSEKRRGRGTNRGTPAFSCFIYYHRLDADLLPKLRTQYVGPLRTSLQTELGSLEKLKERSTHQDARRVELEEKIEELKVFDARIERVIVEGFSSPALDAIVSKEPLDKWTSRDSRFRPPDTRDGFLAQERRYDPDLNDGVRVNIAPLQRAGLLAEDVLAAKDVEKAIADRAEWRADERRWCREGKLPHPGWWAVEGRGA